MTTTEDPLAWAREHMPVCRSLADEFADERPFEGETLAVASHLEATTGVFVETLREGGAELLVTASDPSSTHADVVEFLDGKERVETFAAPEMSDEAFDDAHHRLLERKPDYVLGDGGLLFARLYHRFPDLAPNVKGGTEQTTVGVTRLEAMEADGVLDVPVLAVNDTPMKRWFDNVHGTGESSLVNVEITTNATLTGKTIVVCGYGYCGRGIARKARGLGAHTIVTEIDPRKGMRAHMDGHRVMPIEEAAPEGDIFVTATGSRNVLGPQHVAEMADGAVLANAGHYDVEIDVEGIRDCAEHTSEPREGVTRFHLPGGRRVNLLADGRLVNLSGPYSSGHPAEVMDTTFGAIAAAARTLLEADLEAGVRPVPDRLDREIAERKLDALGTAVDEPTDVQRRYAVEWRRDLRN